MRVVALLLPALAVGLSVRPAQKASPTAAVARVAGSAAMAGAMIASALPAEAAMNYAQLEDCGTSKGFEKRKVQSVKKLENRLKKYEAGSPPYIALQSQVAQTKNRTRRPRVWKKGGEGDVCMPHPPPRRNDSFFLSL